MRAILVILVLAGAAHADMTPDQQRDVLAEAQQTYDRGIALRRADPAEATRLFRAAAERFEFVAADGVVNGLLLYNQANAWLQAGEVGRAIVAYRRADLLRPGDPRIEANLDYARSLRRSQIASGGQRALLDALLGWHRRSPRDARFAVFAAAYVLFWGALLTGRFRRSGAWRWTALAMLPIWLAAGASVAADFTPDARTDGVIVVNDVTVRKGNGEGFAPRFEEPLHQGVEFDLIEQRGDWLRIELPDGKTGWVRRSQAEMV